MSGPVTLPGYREFFEGLNHHDRKRVLHTQWDLSLEGFGKGFDFPALLCWHEAVDRARAWGIRPRDDETPSRVTGPGAKAVREIDAVIARNEGGGEAAGPVVRPRKATAAAIDKEMEAYFG